MMGFATRLFNPAYRYFVGRKRVEGLFLLGIEMSGVTRVSDDCGGAGIGHRSKSGLVILDVLGKCEG